MKLLAVFFSLLFFGQYSSANQYCRNDIQNRVFYVARGTEPTRVTNPKVIGMFVQVYDMMPEVLHPLFCSFRKFTIVEPYDASADSGMNFRAGLFKVDLDISHWQSWKEQLNYGVPNTDEFLVSEKLPIVTVSLKHSPVLFLYSIIIHELGHNLPRSIGFRSRWEARQELGKVIIPEYTEFCSYWCNGKATLKIEKSEDLYNRIYTKTDWLTLYSNSAEEDFADSFAYYVLIHFTAPDGDYQVKMPSGTQYSVRKLMESPLYERKMSLLKEAYAMLPRTPIVLSNARVHIQ